MVNTPDNIEEIISSLNNLPEDDFLGYSPNDMKYLLYDALGKDSPVQFLDIIDDSSLDKMPLFRIVEAYLKIIQREKQIKLTPLGALPRKVITELYDLRFLLDDFIEIGLYKLWREEDCISIRSARLTAELAGLVKKTNGILSLKKATIKLLETNNRQQLFQKFFNAFVHKFPWSFNDAYPEVPVGQFGWGFSVILLDRLGNKVQTSNFYADLYGKAFPNLYTFFQDDYSTENRQFNHCYSIRTFNRFLLWFGFITIKKKDIINTDNEPIESTHILSSIFKITR
ncbi:hypothetical protein [Aquirufa nivalisilvae]|uniref:hypothetical protein n=1 Tax=Aquirufa nivalisilvae TaxID=2516557 RepID=UPI0010329754|nr:hypothetical protein [Aquirufa nivalisilvae]TBH75997.1 hypothetical protein EWU22_00170 [Aquirufa nivalisilvae]